MDKRVIFSVAGSGKTTYIVDSLSKNKRSLIVTYTQGNYQNLCQKISKKFGLWPDNVFVMTYFKFLYNFCYKPLLSDETKAKGIIYPNKIERSWATKENDEFYLSKDRYFYHNRLAFYIENRAGIDAVIHRLEKYFDEFIIDEVQDIAGRDFNFLEKIMAANMDMLFVGDFYQHTFDTSRDGTVNKSLFDDFGKYEKRFVRRGFYSDKDTLKKSWRCSPCVCKFVTDQLGIEMSSNRNMSDDKNSIVRIEDLVHIKDILGDESIVKLHLQMSYNWGITHRNWGDVKGEDNHQDICVVLNKGTAEKYAKGLLYELPPITRNKFYVALTRAHGKVFLIDERLILRQ